jgi:hypothetical protein
VSATPAAGQPIVEYARFGSVHLSFDEGASYTTFPSVKAFAEALEDIDRQVVAHDLAAIVAFEAERDAYFERVQELRAEREEVAG